MSDLAKRLAALNPKQQEVFLRRARKEHEKREKNLSLQIMPHERGSAPVALSFAQERLWFLDQFEPLSTAYTIPILVRLRGTLSLEALQHSVSTLVQRHETLRTTFTSNEGRPVQVVAPFLSLAIPVIDLRDSCRGQQQGEIVESIVKQAMQRPFDLRVGPLLHIHLLWIETQEYMLVISMHHIISDAWSMNVLLRELSQLYQAFLQNAISPLQELAIQYADYVLWQRSVLQGELWQRLREYWQQQLAGAPQLLDLPTDYPRGAVQSSRGATYRNVVPASLLHDLRALSRRENVTLFMTLLASFQLLLMRYTGQVDIVVGTPIANRTRRELEDLVGFFVNTLALRTDLSGNPDFRQLLARVSRVTQQAYTHQDFPFEQLVEMLQLERSLSYTPVFQVLFTLQNLPTTEMHLAGSTWQTIEVEPNEAKFDLTLALSESPDGLYASFTYRTDLFVVDTIERFFQHWQHLLGAIVADPTCPIAHLPLLSSAEQQFLLHTVNQTSVAMPPTLGLHTYFEQQVQRTPDATAVYDGDRQLTYRELDRWANRVARHLQEAGVQPDVLVGLCLPHSAELLMSVLGILKAGGAYVPLDPTSPQKRLASIVEDAHLSYLLTTTTLLDLFPAIEQVICLDADWDALSQHDGENVSVRNMVSTHLAYVIYTSGSTGQPKGVMISHQGLVHYVDWACKSYGIAEGRGTLLHSSLAFDLTVTSLFPPLVMGRPVWLVAEDAGIDGLATVLRQGLDLSLVKLTPAHLDLLNQSLAPTDLVGTTRMLIIGGEALHRESLTDWRQYSPETRLINEYGPTETVVGCCIYEVPRQAAVRANVPIGRPIANMQIYLLDENMQPVPLGVIAEVYIGGIGLARGYLHRAHLTAEYFVPHPFSAEAGARLYRTGDLARYISADGDLEYVGRIGHQVKIRGYRIELGEIEAVLRTHPMVQDVVVILKEDVDAEKFLIAYVVARSGAHPGRAELREWLAQQVPAYMLPARVVLLDALPLTSNGKLDRRALPTPEQSPLDNGVVIGPRTPLEEVISLIWADLLHLPPSQMSIHDNFFALGGHSLLGTRVISRLRQGMQVEVPLRFLFEAPTIATLAPRIELLLQGDTHSAAPVLVPQVRSQSLPLSFAQERLWFLHQLEPESTAYHIPVALRLRGRFSVAAFEESVQQLIERHESLRTVFVSHEGQPVQVIAPVFPLTIPVIDLHGVAIPQREEQTRRLLHEEAGQPFDLVHGPLLRLRLLRLEGDEQVVLVNMHHIVTDGWSMEVLVRELSALYQAQVQATPNPLPALPIQYADYALWQREWLQGKVLEQQLGYWKRQLADAPGLLELPTDHPRPAVQTFVGAHQTRLLSPELLQQVHQMSQQENVTLFMILLAAFQVLLMRYSGQTDIVVGTPIANRTRSETEGLIGFFVNTLVLRSDLSGQPSFRDLLARVREVTLQSYAHQDLPFEQIVEALQVERTLSHSPLFQVLFVLQNTPGVVLDVAGLSWEPVEMELTTTKFDLSLILQESAYGLQAEIEYNTALFEVSTIARLLDHWQVLVAAIVANPVQRITELSLLTKSEREQLLMQRDQIADEASFCLHERFEQQVEHTPDAIAVTFERTMLTYRELNTRANQLAHSLQRSGVGVESFVGVAMERSLELVIALLAVLKAGGAYVPLDPTYPRERLASMLAEIQPSVVITQSHLLSIVASDHPHVMCLDTDWEALHHESIDNPVSQVTPEDLAYMIYTSGSTGKPKGTMVTHANVMRLFTTTDDWFRFQATDAWTLFHSYAFDFSVWELWGALLYGGRLVVVPYWISRSPDDCYQLLLDEQVTVLNQTPSAFRQLIQVKKALTAPLARALRYVIFGGEALDLAMVSPWMERYGDQHPQLVNMYGITETTVHVTYRPLTYQDLHRKQGSVIGGPIPDLQCYILDRYQELVPFGVPGEFYVGGRGLARGYWRRAENTAERFVPHPFGSEPGARLYRTGDLVRRLPSGEMEYLGRVDQQVKVRGFRIELGEIEEVLRAHPTVQDVVVLAREDVPGEKRLVGYVVARLGAQPSREELRGWLSQNVPDYMVPNNLVLLDALPLSSNGKLDRRALLAPEESPLHEGVVLRPRTPLEELVCIIWADLLHLPPSQVSIHDNFFALGGHSLLATQVISRLRQDMLVEMPLRMVFEATTIATLAERIELLLKGDMHSAASSLVPQVRSQTLPLSFAQERLWFLHQLEPESTAYHIPVALRLRGQFSVAAFEESVQQLIERHESLRTVFVSHEGQPVQVISPVFPLTIPVIDLHGVAIPQREEQIRRLLHEEAGQPFDLVHGPLLRLRLLWLEEEVQVVLVNMHHIVTDGWSMEVLVRELSALYQAQVQATPNPLPALPIQYADYALWQRQWLQGKVLEQQLAYWKRQLAGAPALLELPTDHPRPAVQTFVGARHRQWLAPELLRSLQQLSQREGVTLFMTLLAAFQVLLMRYSGQTDLLVGTPIANRTRAETEGVIGMFVNTLVLRSDLSGNPGFRELLTRVREVTLQAYTHQDLPFEQLVEALQIERSLSYAPLFQVLFVLQNMPQVALDVAGLTWEAVEVEQTTTKFDLSLYLQEDIHGLRMQIEYNTALFEKATIARLLDHWQVVLHSIVAQPEQRIEAVALLTQGEREQLLVQWNQTSSTPAQLLSLHEHFEQQVTRTPDAIAIIFEEQQLSYAELNEQSNRLAVDLQRRGVGPDILVGIFMQRTPALVIALLAILKAGGAYVPLDPTYPSDRIAAMLDDAQVTVILTQTALLEKLPQTLADVLCIDSNILHLKHEKQDLIKWVGQQAHLAYVIYTSGSTGRPKGVMGTHQATLNRFHWMWQAYPFAQEEVGCQKTNLSFVDAVWEIFGTLLQGVPLVIIVDDVVKDVFLLRTLLERHAVTRIVLVPSLLRAFLEEESDLQNQLRHLTYWISSGEPLMPDLVQRFQRCLPEKRLINLYGSSEVAADVTYYEVNQHDVSSRVPIGRPIANTQIYLLDASLQLVPVGVRGELYIGGANLAQGYYGRADLTAERFVPDPFGDEPGGRLYRTGDLARYRVDGVIEYLGRIDQQVKLRGFRIEPGEIEVVLRAHPAVQEAIVILREDASGDRSLVAYVVARREAPPSREDLRRWLGQRVPDYMVPASLILLDALPLTPNGKLDWRALPDPKQISLHDGVVIGPRTPLEEVVMLIWADLLPLSPAQISVHDNFFALGGHSLLATQMISRLRQRVQVDLPLRRLFESPTIATLTQHIETLLQGNERGSIPAIEPVARSQEVPLSFAQERLWFLQQFEPLSNAYHIPLALRLQGPLSMVALEKSMQQLIERHESLRTTFVFSNEGQAVQVIAADLSLAIPIIDIGGVSPAERKKQTHRLLQQAAGHSFDLAHGPLLRLCLLRLEEHNQVLLVNMHHIITDGWSMGVLTRDLTTLYQAQVQGTSAALPVLPIQYADYALWQRAWLKGEILEQQLGYWKRQLADAPALLDLPIDHPRPAVQTFTGAHQTRLLPPELLQQVQQVSQQENVTLFMTLLAVFQVLLLRYSGQTDIVVGSPIANRTHAETEGLIGFFVNTLVLRSDLSGHLSFRDLLARVREVTLQAYAHQDVPFEQLVEAAQVERSLSHSPLFQVFFVLQNMPGVALDMAGLTWEAVEMEQTTTKFDLSMYLQEDAQGLRVLVEYNTALFEASSIARFLDHWQVLLGAIVENPAQCIEEVPLLTQGEREQLLVQWNQTVSTPEEPPLLLHERFEQQVARTPDAIAVVFEQQHLSYGQLNMQANRLALELQRRGVGPDVLVGICLERSLELVVAVLAVLKAGGAYVPFDPAAPAQRLTALVADAGVRLVLTQPVIIPLLTAHAIPALLVPSVEEEDAPDIENVTSQVQGEHLAYMIYTSGSTGKPKGVMNTHWGISNRLAWMLQTYRLAAPDRVVQKTPMSFDVSVWELFWPLLTGATLVVAEPGGHQDPRYLKELVEQQGITTMHFVPTMLQAFLEEPSIGSACGGLRQVFCSGEALTADLQARFFVHMLERVRLYNLYGPTEAAIEVTSWSCSPGERSVPIGRPIANTQIYLLDGALQPVPIGAGGELYIGGVSLARGYHGRADLTGERFVPDPYGPEPGSRLYRTGDLARYRADGAIEYVGRLDHQVKLRGVRIELGEIEAVLRAHPAIQDVVVLAREDVPGDMRLVAYLVGRLEQLPTNSELRFYLQERLPSPMLPSALVFLEVLPLTPNGKLDRQALPVPEEEGDVSEEARTPLEELLAGVWGSLLGRRQVGRHDNFFALGGHSLLATQLITRLRAILSIDMSLRVVFEAPTIASFAQRVEQVLLGGEANPVPPLMVTARPSELPLSYAQQRLWFLDQLEPESTAYLIPGALRVQGAIDVQTLQLSLLNLFYRHESLRTIFELRGEQPLQMIYPASPVRLPVIDLHGLEYKQRELEVRRLASQEANSPCDLATGPLLRVTLLRLEKQEHILFLTLHHIITDGWSNQVLVRDLTAFYQAHLQGTSVALPVLPIQYADYALWQREWLKGEVLERQLGYWKRQLAGVPALLELPTDHPRPAVQTFVGARHRQWLAPELLQALQELSQQENVTLFMTLLAAFQVLLLRYSGQTDIVVGTPIANRTRAETEDMIGLFVNTLVLRSDLSGQPSFRELLTRVREVTLQAYTHQDVPFEQVVEALQVERSLSHSPLFQVLFVLQNMPQATLDVAGLTWESVEMEQMTTKFDLSLYLQEDAQGLQMQIEYNTALFEASSIARFLDHWQVLLRSIVALPAQHIEDLPLLTQGEREQLLVQWNQTSRPPEPPLLVLERFEQQVACAPDAIAVVFEQEHLSYSQLNGRANRLAVELQKRGVGPDVLVGICLERSSELLVAVLAVLKAGGAYVPFDLTVPEQRLTAFVVDAGVRLVLTQPEIFPLLSMHAIPALLVSSVEGEAVLPETENVVNQVDGEHLAYMIYTSGSTGKPKGVMNTHRGISNRLVWMQHTYQLEASDRVVQKTPVSFDVSVWELFWPLIAGATLVVAEPGGHQDPRYLKELIQQQGITTMHFVPAMLQVFLEEPDLGLACGSLRQVLCSGEALSADLQARFFVRMPDEVYLHNLYGPTEAAIDVTSWVCSPGERSVPIGRPIANTQIYLLDEALQPVPIGVGGELYIGGVNLARGYHGRADLTGERFVPDPYGSEPGSRLYRTGDLARYRPDGAIEYVGRLDHQVKLRGVRIELGEIEATLRAHPTVIDAVVVLREEREGRKYLVAYVVSSAMEEVLEQELPMYLRERLPEYMVPSRVVLLPTLPLMANGKVDRKKLPALERTRLPLTDDVVPRSPVEQIVAGIWQQVLGLEQVGIHDNFFALGGDSIQVMQIVTRARQAGLQLTPKHIFRHQTIAQLIPAIIVAGGSNVDNPIEETIVGPVPLTPIQHWFFEHNLPQPQHFNQALLLQVPPHWDVSLIQSALAAVVRQHDVFRLRFLHTKEGWQQLMSPEEAEEVPLEIIDVSVLPLQEQPAELEKAKFRLQSSLNIVHGPLLRVAYIPPMLASQSNVQPSARLLFAVHHLAIDGVSWRILLDDLQTAMQQLQHNQAIQLPAHTVTFQQWSLYLRRQAHEQRLQRELPYWLHAAHVPVDPLPLDLLAGENLERSRRHVQKVLSREETDLLLHTALRPYHCQIQDLLLVALLQALADWMVGSQHVRIDIEGHGREEVGEQFIDVSRTVGWFTSIYPVLFTLPDPSANLTEWITSIKEQLRMVPDKGIGYGLLRYLSQERDLVDQLQSLPPSQISFNYLGQFDQVMQVAHAGDTPLQIAPESAGEMMGPDNPRAYLLDINGMVVGGQLRMTWIYSEHMHRASTIEALSEGFMGHLRVLLDHCLLPGVGRYTPSDFPLAHLNQGQLDTLLAHTDRALLEDLYPLTSMQQGMLFHSLLEHTSGVYITQLLYTLRNLNLPLFVQAWERITKLHSILRTSFVWQGLSEPLQMVWSQVSLPITILDWRELSTEQQALERETFVKADRARGFDVQQAPLMRLTVMRLSEQSMQVLWTHHHILLDGWSVSLLLHELFACYTALAHETEPRLEHRRPYRDYITWYQAQQQKQAEAYWREYLHDFSTPTALGIDHGRTEDSPGQNEVLYARQELAIATGTVERWQEMARQHKLTLNTLLQGAWACVLSHYSGQSDVVFGTVVAGRPPELDAVERMMGMFINSLPVRVMVPQDIPVVLWLQRLQAQMAEQRQYQHTALVEVQGWSTVPRNQPLFESILVFENYPVGAMLTEQHFEVEVEAVVSTTQTNYPLTITVVTQPDLTLRVTYQSRRFAAQSIQRLLLHLKQVLEQFARQPAQRLVDIELLTMRERHQQLVEINVTETAYPPTCLHRLFEEQVARTPDAIALVQVDEQVTYASLNLYANQLAHYLSSLGVGPEVPVGICLDHTLGMIIAVLATLKAGGYYLPVDPAYPGERRALLLDDAGAKVVVTHSRYQAQLPLHLTSLCLDRDWTKIMMRELEPPLPRVHLDNAAYVLYTSGSTGTPKGVIIEHRNILNYVMAVIERADLYNPGVYAMLQPLSVDSALTMLFPPLITGGVLQLISREVALDVQALQSSFARYPIDYLKIAPSHLIALMTQDSPTLLHTLRRLIIGGEASQWNWVQTIRAALPHGLLYNHYGPTETTVGSLMYAVLAHGHEQGHSLVPIGTPIANTQIYVLDELLQPVPMGVVGELYISGAGLARGYLNRPTTTAERFVPHPFALIPGARLYKTGDLVRILEDTTIEYVGRNDEQVKIRGYRIELGEIETVLCKHEVIREAVVLAQESPSGGKQLVAYLVVQGREDISIAEVRRFLRTHLPEQMLPSLLLCLDALPLTPHGKVDRRALMQLDMLQPVEVEVLAPPQTAIEIQLAAIWIDLLRLPQVSIHQNFFELGGHSLIATQLLSRIQSEFAISLPLRSLFETTTIAEVALLIEQRQNEIFAQAENDKLAEFLDDLEDLADDDLPL